MLSPPPATTAESSFRKLAASCGLVPARYSCKLVKRSPSGSAAGAASGLLRGPKYCSCHAPGRPSPFQPRRVLPSFKAGGELLRDTGQPFIVGADARCEGARGGL